MSMTFTTLGSPPAWADQTWSETTGGLANTWTNYTNAGGTGGPQIPAYATVQIACKVQGFRVADGNTWWYRIASAPWNYGFYVSADAFYNNGATSGSLAGTPFVDPAIADCSSGGGTSETTGGVANTWTNYIDAGGTGGPQIPAYATVQIACKVQGFRVADGNTWWYRIASAPWNYGFYVSADAFYNNGAASGSLIGTPFVDPAVPECDGGTGGGPNTPSVTLAQGPSAPAGYRYSIALAGFTPSTAISVTCYDSVSPGGFYSFSLTTNAAGAASTTGYCYSGDGPDHWVVANNRVVSNHVAWSSATGTGGSGTGGSGTGGSGTGGSGTGGGTPGGGAVYYQPRYSSGDPQAPAEVQTVAKNGWSHSAKHPKTKADCPSDKSGSFADPYANPPRMLKRITTLAAWSVGRMGPVYFLDHDMARAKNINTIILYDPGSYANFFDREGCDQFYEESRLYAEWLGQNKDHKLIILAGKDTYDPNWHGHGSHQGIQQKLFPEIRGRKINDRLIARQVLVCNYSKMSHPDVLSNYRDLMTKSQISTAQGWNSCPKQGKDQVWGWNP